MALDTIVEQGRAIVEGTPDERLLERPADVSLVIEACMSADTELALLYAENLGAEFFDLSSRVAGDVLQKLRQYRVRLAAVCPPGTVRFSTRFGEMLAEERRLPHFGVFDTREDALAWLLR
ncbi:MAG: DUF4180 domain-containing protein [Vicinamibacteria bacterium]